MILYEGRMYLMVLNSEVQSIVKDRFTHLQERVRITTFTQEFECQFCREARSLNEELASLTDKIDLEVFDLQKNRIEAERYHIEEIPATAISGDKDYGIRFYGVSGGYEFTSFLEAIMMVSRRESGLSAESKMRLQGWKKPTRIRVFTTLTCPYCPQAVSLAHKMALENDFIAAEMIEIGEFPHLANKYQVYGVPKVVINEIIQFEGALPEAQFLDRVLQV
ncbi:MAG: protein disulfide oxidoreductase [bacterium]